MMTSVPSQDHRDQLVAGAFDEAVSRRVQLVLWQNRPRQPPSERRRHRRYPFPYPIQLYPVAADGITPSGDKITVLGKDLSEHGLGFYHTKPLEERRAVVTFACGAGGPTKLLMALTWCRFGSHGLFENGGRFLQVVTG